MELKIKRLWHSPASIETTASQVLLANLLWVEHNEELYDTILNAAELKSYGFGQHICHFGDPTSGIYVVVAGMIKVVYMPTPALIEARNQYGKIPNSELYMDLTFSQPETDYFSSGFVFGEYGVLRDDPWASDIIAETSLLVYHIPKEVIIQAIERYEDPYDSLEGQLWRSVGMRRATGLLEQLPRYQNNLDKIQIVLQRSTIPINDSHNVFEIPDYVSEVVVIEGYATNQDTNDTYIAPFIVPRSCTKLIQLDNPATVNRILIIADEDVDLSTTGNEDRISLGGKNVNWTSSRNYSHSLTRRNFNPYHISECGVQVVKCGAQCNDNSRIVGGRETYRGQFPWMVNM
ncbi:Sodium/hydrogen exchanger 11 [Folsomia candida]|uniref:Sodium/hydrogen exchanger 11 n=1 Tax=Folsomia candida TaxID=158441 RepID=A0A226DD25_FOLCA|nr:Sodium/hydrogen exchanger 11 [Folsomia candida]